MRAGLLTLEDACKRYHLSVEEFLSWQRLIERHGLPGLRATRLQDYRDAAGPGELTARRGKNCRYPARFAAPLTLSSPQHP